MKKKSIFAIAGTLVLLATGLFSFKTVKKTALVSTFFYKVSGVAHTAITGISGRNLLVTKSTTSGHLAFFRAGATGTQYTLSTSGGAQLYSAF